MEIEANDIDAGLDSLSRKLCDQIDSDNTQIAFLEKRIEKNNDLLKVVRSRLGAVSPAIKATGYGSKSDTIRNAIMQIAKPRFSQNDVEFEIKRLNPNMIIKRDRIRSALWTLQDKGELIKQVEKGNNRQPAEFEKLASSTNGVKMPQRSSTPPRPQHLAMPVEQ